MMDDELIAEHRRRALCPDHPVIRGTAQNPDAFFQGREACNPFYLACSEIMQKEMDKLAGPHRAGNITSSTTWAIPRPSESSCSWVPALRPSKTWSSTWSRRARRSACVLVRLYRPFSLAHFVAGAAQEHVRKVAVLDRTKEAGTAGEPLYQDVLTAVVEGGSQPACRA